jgi:hypothetical protein
VFDFDPNIGILGGSTPTYGQGKFFMDGKGFNGNLHLLSVVSCQLLVAGSHLFANMRRTLDSFMRLSEK